MGYSGNYYVLYFESCYLWIMIPRMKKKDIHIILSIYLFTIFCLFLSPRNKSLMLGLHNFLPLFFFFFLINLSFNSLFCLLINTYLLENRISNLIGRLLIEPLTSRIRDLRKVTIEWWV